MNWDAGNAVTQMGLRNVVQAWRVMLAGAAETGSSGEKMRVMRPAVVGGRWAGRVAAERGSTDVASVAIAAGVIAPVGEQCGPTSFNTCQEDWRVQNRGGRGSGEAGRWTPARYNRPRRIFSIAN